MKREKNFKNKKIKMNNKIIENIVKGFTSDKYNTSNIENG